MHAFLPPFNQELRIPPACNTNRATAAAKKGRARALVLSDEMQAREMQGENYDQD